MLLNRRLSLWTDLPCKGDISVEIERWRLKVGDHVHQNIPGLQSALKFADLYPNIHTIFKLLIVLPVTSVCWKCPFSVFVLSVTSVCWKCPFLVLYRLKTRVRSTMTGGRLCGLAMLHSHRYMDVNRENILRGYDASGHWKIGWFF